MLSHRRMSLPLDAPHEDTFIVPTGKAGHGFEDVFIARKVLVLGAID